MFRTRVGPFGLTGLGRRALANCVGKLAFTSIAKSTASAVLFLGAEILPGRQCHVGGGWDSVWNTETNQSYNKVRGFSGYLT